jgi:hypothetical protein
MVALAAIATVIILTYMTLQLLGPQPRRILLSVEERARYTKNIIGRFGAFLYIANVVGALSSLATVYVFLYRHDPIVWIFHLWLYYIYDAYRYCHHQTDQRPPSKRSLPSSA